MENTAILYGVPKVAYSVDGCTPFPMCVKACAEYLGIPTDYTRIMAESGAAFRLVWDTASWNGGNVDAIFTFDDPLKIFMCGLRAMGRELKMLARTGETKKEEFIDFIRNEINAGNPVIALGIIGPPEACVITGYRDDGNTLLGWNVFQEYPEHQAYVKVEQNGYFATTKWWENPDTVAIFATGTRNVEPFSMREILQNAVEVLDGRMCGTYAKGLLAYDAWKNALLRDDDFSNEAILPVLVERMMCHGDAMDCLSDGRRYAAQYLHEMAAKHPEQAQKLEAVAKEFDTVSAILWKEMVPLLGGWGRGELQVRRLANAENRRLFAGIIGRMKQHDERALILIRELVEEF